MLALCISLAFLAGCSSIKLAYNNADDLAYWWLDRYVDFTEAQTLSLRPALSQLHRWHRLNELPALAGTLARLRAEVLLDTTQTAVCGYFAELQPRLRAVLDAAEPTVVALVPTLSAAQLDTLQERYRKNNTEWREDWLDVSTDQREDKRQERLVKNIERFYGSLQREQQSVLREVTRRTPLDASLIYREIQRRQQDTLATLRQLAQRPPSAVSAGMQALLQRTLEPSDVEYNRHVEMTRTTTCAAIAAMHNVTTAANRQLLAANLASLEDDLRALAAQRK